MDWLTILLIAGGLLVAAFWLFYLFCWLTDAEPVEYMGRHLVPKRPVPPQSRKHWRLVVERR